MIAQEVSPNDTQVQKNVPNARMSFGRLRCLGFLKRLQYILASIFTHFFFFDKKTESLGRPDAYRTLGHAGDAVGGVDKQPTFAGGTGA